MHALQHYTCADAKMPATIVIDHPFDMNCDQVAQGKYSHHPANILATYIQKDDIRNNDFNPSYNDI